MRAGALAAAALVLFTACARWEYASAGRRVRRGRYEAALKGYLAFAERSPAHALADEALFEAGRLAGDVLGDDVLARTVYRKLLDGYADRPGVGRRAEWALFNTPNYFPLIVNGQWVEGDSDTGGRNARVKVVCRPVEDDPSALRLVNSYYAGDKFVKDLSVARIYRKVGLELRESAPGRKEHAVVLKHPFEQGTRWTTRRDGRTVTYTVDGVETVRVRGGEFKRCLKVRGQAEGAASWQVDYYAPGVGRVLTTLATSSTERRNTELLSYDLGGGVETPPGEAPREAP